MLTELLVRQNNRLQSQLIRHIVRDRIGAEDLPQTTSIVGDVINFRGLTYGPVNEQGVVFLFSKVSEDLGIRIEEIKEGFPDAIGRIRQKVGGREGWVRKRIEFEYESSQFRKHKHKPSECDLVICWEHDWTDCPVEVISLKDVIGSLAGRASEPIIHKVSKHSSTESWAAKLEWTSLGTKALFKKVLAEITDSLPDVVHKPIHHWYRFYYSRFGVKTQFCVVILRKTSLWLRILTDPSEFSDPKNKAKAYKGWFWPKKLGTEKGFNLNNEKDLDYAMQLVSQAYNYSKRISAAPSM